MRFSAHQLDAALIYCLVLINSYTVKCETCGRNELLSPKALCCEPTCTEDCASAGSRGTYKNEPMCVCLPGFVRHEGRCIRKICCPKNVTDCDEAPPTTCITETTTVAPEQCHSCGHSRKKQKSAQKAASSPDPEISIPEKEQLIYILNTDAYPGQFYKIEPVKPYEPDSLCSCEATLEEQPKRFNSPHSKKCSSSSKTVPIPYVARPPKCNRTQELVFCRPCCIPTCDDDCTSADRCARVICVVELNCVCVSGYVLHNGQCVRREECPPVDYEGDDVPEEKPVGPEDSPEFVDDGDDYVELVESDSQECEYCDEYYE